MDIHSWRLRTLLSAVEARLDASAEDDGERQRNRAKLYAPPPGHVKKQAAGRVRGQGMDLESVRAMMSQMSAQDAQIGRAVSG
ncbi:hypothetical protein [Streptomyces sp. enrichment culture]|uniref:hypothetical protein n=1 Tax=Streptomyces sp. enrichment culture TaxID=1795815 RepID=UPI003F546B69